MRVLIDIPDKLRADMEIISTTRSLRTGNRVFLKDLYSEAIDVGMKIMKDRNLKEGLKHE